jgi:catechol 2,3-dioxygenase-like lactoylglutathione lyase family enzyme
MKGEKMPYKGFAVLSRREALAALGGLVAGVRVPFASADPLLFFTGIDHITLEVQDVQKSAAFYVRLFGNNVLRDKKSSRHYIKVGPNYFALVPAGQGPKTRVHTYLGAGITNFHAVDVKRSLSQAGVEAHDAPGGGLLIVDPDGVPMQLWENDSWKLLSRFAAPVSISGNGEPKIQPTQINHLLLAVPDADKSAVFYAKVFGPPASHSENPKRIWFRAGTDRVGLSILATDLGSGKDQVSGQHLAGSGKLGIDHFGLIAPFDRETLARELHDAGAKVLPQVTRGPDAAAIDFRDPDGYRVQIEPPTRSRA